jgi:hypothetical protein
MAINQAALARIRESKITAESIAQVFQLLSVMPALGTTLTFNMGWQTPDDVIADGELIPHLTFTLRAPATIRPINGSNPGPNLDGSQAAT